jgi:hypothetical protein
VQLKSAFCTAFLVVASCVAGRARADSITLGFDVIESTASTAARQAQGQFRVTVSDVGVGPNQALFTFTNVGTIASSITDIYFQDGTLLAMANIINAPVSRNGEVTWFTEGAAPKNLPGGETLTPKFSPVVGINFFSLDTVYPLNQLGVNPGEQLGVTFDLKNGMNFQNVLKALATTPPSTVTNPSLRIGINVQGIGPQGATASYVNVRPTVTTPTTPTTPRAAPLPGTAWAGLALLGGVGAKRIWRRRFIAA